MTRDNFFSAYAHAYSYFLIGLRFPRFIIREIPLAPFITIIYHSTRFLQVKSYYPPLYCYTSWLSYRRLRPR